MSHRKRLAFIAAALLFPLSLVAGVEGLLRLKGYGGYPSFLRKAGRLPVGSDLWMVEPAASKPYFFANPQRPGYAEQYDFQMPKPAGVFRVFLFGESAAKGYPQPRNLAVSSFLQVMLSELHPDKRVEVINLGTTAIASFPIRHMVKESLACSPDLFVFYVGNNEFFGAYGTASINSSGNLPPSALGMMRELRGLAMVQYLDPLLRRKPDTSQSLMEQMVDRAVIPHDSSLRTAATRNLEANLGAMARDAKRAGIPVILCTTASNESGLAPIGEEADDGAVAALASCSTDPSEDDLRRVLRDHPYHTRAHFLLGRALSGAGRIDEAREAFLMARDLDTMPWRPTRALEDAVRRVAQKEGVILCDVARSFRERDPVGAAGWDLLDDHVHLSLKGQAEAARCMARSWVESRAGASAGADPAGIARLAGWQEYASRLGANQYDEYRVNHTLRVIFGVPFMKQRNPKAYERFSRLVEEAERRMDPGILRVAREWQTAIPHAGGLRPLTGMIAREHLRRKEPASAEEWYRIAATQVPTYTSWNLEYSYSWLLCREMTEGALDEADRSAAKAAIARGRVLLANGFTGTGMTERHMGRLHQLLSEFAEAIPYLEVARLRLHAEDLVACEQALVLSYVRCGRAADAMAIAERGARESGKFAPVYESMIRFIQEQR